VGLWLQNRLFRVENDDIAKALQNLHRTVDTDSISLQSAPQRAWRPAVMLLAQASSAAAARPSLVDPRAGCRRSPQSAVRQLWGRGGPARWISSAARYP
jgi:hypothetical protein